jgi:hypothetical protein
MYSTSEVIRAILLAIIVLLAIMAPPIWWYRRGRRPGERREKRWGAIFFGILILISVGYVRPTAQGDWIGWIVNMVRVFGGAWMIAWGAKGSRV